MTKRNQAPHTRSNSSANTNSNSMFDVLNGQLAGERCFDDNLLHSLQSVIFPVIAAVEEMQSARVCHIPGILLLQHALQRIAPPDI